MKLLVSYDKSRAAELLRESVDVLNLYGWTQRVSYDRTTGAFCAIGALSEAKVRLHASWEQENLARNAADKVAGGNIVRFNDDQHTTKQGVTEALLKAATKLDGKKVKK